MEIEYKYLIDILEFKKEYEDISKLIQKKKDITQVYISMDTEVRLRKIEQDGLVETVQTIKSDGAVSREEIEFMVDEQIFNDIVKYKLYKGDIISKTRFLLNIGDYTAELDIFKGPLEGLVLVEVEFDSMMAANNFKAPNWFGENVTYNKKYKNKNLALNKEAVLADLKDNEIIKL